MERIINQVKSNWNKDLIIRFLYIKLAPFFQRDLEFFLASDEEKERQYKQGFINRFPNIVCSTLADYYVQLFSEFGINAKKIIATSASIPLFAIIVEGDLGFYFLDPINDLFSNQYGLRPYYFGIIPKYRTTKENYPELTKLEREYVQELDAYLGITYLNDLFKSLESKLKNPQLAREFFGYDKNDKLDLKELKYHLMNNSFINLGSVNGPFERAQMYKFLSERLLNRGERRHTKTLIVGDKTDAHIQIQLTNPDSIIILDEEKHNDKYMLIKK